MQKRVRITRPIMHKCLPVIITALRCLDLPATGSVVLCSYHMLSEKMYRRFMRIINKVLILHT